MLLRYNSTSKFRMMKMKGKASDAAVQQLMEETTASMNDVLQEVDRTQGMMSIFFRSHLYTLVAGLFALVVSRGYESVQRIWVTLF